MLYARTVIQRKCSFPVRRTLDCQTDFIHFGRDVPPFKGYLFRIFIRDRYHFLWFPSETMILFRIFPGPNMLYKSTTFQDRSRSQNCGRHLPVRPIFKSPPPPIPGRGGCGWVVCGGGEDLINLRVCGRGRGGGVETTIFQQKKVGLL